MLHDRKLLRRKKKMQNLGDILYGGQKMVWGKGAVAHGFVFLSGVEGIDPASGKASSNIETQTRVALDKVKSRLEDAGTDFSQIVKHVAYIVGRENILGYRNARASWMKENPESAGNQPASTLLVVAGLAQPELLVEVDVIAVIPE
jgi:2-iminobutanoate/2-iminopropanoate deaminase